MLYYDPYTSLVIDEPEPNYYTFSGNANAFATKPTVNPASGCQNCDHKPIWERPGCELGKIACEYKAYDRKVTKDVSTGVRNSVLGQANAVQNTARDWTRSLGDATNSTVQWMASGFGQLGPALPFIAAGGILIVVILLVAGRR